MYSTLDIVDDVARHQCIPNDGQITASLAKYVDVFGEAHLRRILEKYAAYYNAASYCPSLYVTDTNRSGCRFRCPAGMDRRLRTRSTRRFAASAWSVCGEAQGLRADAKHGSSPSQLHPPVGLGRHAIRFGNMRSSKNSKANRIETGELSGGIRRNLFGGSQRKIAKKIV
jgi:hypothetical protein